MYIFTYECIYIYSGKRDIKSQECLLGDVPMQMSAGRVFVGTGYRVAKTHRIPYLHR